MFKFKQTLTLCAVLLTALFSFTACNNSDESTVTSSSNSLSYDVNGTDVEASGLGSLTCYYNEDFNVMTINGISGLNASSTTGGFDHSVTIVISELENLSDLVGATIPMETPGVTTLNWSLVYNKAPNPSSTSINPGESGTINITSVSGNKLVGTFSAECGDFLNNAYEYSITDGSFNNIDIIIQ